MLCFRATIEHFSLPAAAACTEPYRPLLSVYRDQFLELLTFRYPELLNDTLSFMVPLARARGLPVEVLTDLATVMSVGTHISRFYLTSNLIFCLTIFLPPGTRVYLFYCTLTVRRDVA